MSEDDLPEVDRIASGMGCKKYVLDDDGQAVEWTGDLLEWARRYERTKGIAFNEAAGGSVSTIFLGLDFNLTGDGPPLMFETLVRSGPDGARESEFYRYSTRAEADAGHAAHVAKLKGSLH